MTEIFWLRKNFDDRILMTEKIDEQKFWSREILVKRNFGQQNNLSVRVLRPLTYQTTSYV